MQWSGSSLTGGCSRVVTKRKCLFDREDGVGWNGWQRNIEDFVNNGVRWTGSRSECMLSKLKLR